MATRTRIPKFKTEEEEREFWKVHELTDFWDDLEDVTDEIVLSPSTRKASLERFQQFKQAKQKRDKRDAQAKRLLTRLRALALKKKRSVNDLILQAISAYLNRRENRCNGNKSYTKTKR